MAPIKFAISRDGEPQQKFTKWFAKPEGQKACSLEALIWSGYQHLSCAHHEWLELCEQLAEILPIMAGCTIDSAMLARQRPHAVIRSISRCGPWRKLRRAPHGKRAMRGVNVSGS